MTMIEVFTALIVRYNKKYCGWSRAGYILYRHLGHSCIKAYLGAFLIEKDYLLKTH